jgi:hypothetical protein
MPPEHPRFPYLSPAHDTLCCSDKSYKFPVLMATAVSIVEVPEKAQQLPHDFWSVISEIFPFALQST